MDWELLWWHWAVLGFVLLIADAAILNIYYLIWFGVGAVGVSAALAAWPEMPAWGQILLFAVLSAALLGIWLLVLRPRHSAENMRRARRELPGQSGVVVNFNNKDRRGMLRLQKPVGGKDVWEFVADFSPAAGERATIDDVDEHGAVILVPPRRAD